VGGNMIFPLPPLMNMKEVSMKKKNVFCVFVFAIVGVGAALWIWNTFLNKEN